MQRPQKISLDFWIIVFLFFYGITSLTTADNLTITYAYSLYSGSESVDFSPNGNYIATGDEDGDVGFWEVGDDEAIDYVNLGGDVQGVTFSPDGRYLAADGNDGNVIVWLLDVATRTTVRGTYVHDDAGNINSIAYSPDGRYVAVGVDLRWAYLWDLNSGEMLGWGINDSSEVYDVAFSPDGKYLATGNDNGDLTLRELNSWWTDDVNKIDLKPGGNVRSVAFSPNGNYLAADGYDGINTYVNIYNMDTGRVAWQITSGDVYAIAFSPNGEYIALGDDEATITFYSIGANPTHVGEITASDEVLDLAWSPDGTLITDGRDVWNVTQPTPKPPDSTQTKQEPDVTVSFSPSSMQSPAVGEQLTLSLRITDGENVSGYQATVKFDTTALKYVQSDNGDYLPDGAFFIPPKAEGGTVTLAATSLAGASNGDGTLATITFEIVAVKDSTLTLSDVLLTNSAGQSSKPLVEATQITESSLLSNGINIELPSDIISEVAYAPNSTYFIVKAKYPNLTGVSGADILYGSCIFTLQIPDGMQGFVFPIKTRRDAAVDFLVSVGVNIIPLGGTFLDALDLFSKINNFRNRELKIELHTDARHREPPETEMECIVLLKHSVDGEPNGIDITIEQQYVDRDRGRMRLKVYKSKRWNFDDGWAAPPAQVTIFDYPPFQLLPAEVQQYLLLQFSEFGATESGLIPKQTALLANYPNPFNPETWIPYQLATPADVSIAIYAADGKLVRTLELGHLPVGTYESRSRAAYWDGRNALGEPVASGVYFYTLTAGEFTATRKMLIRK